MAGIPQNFQSISPVIANYDFVDIASGTGYVNFYLGSTVDLKLMSNFTFYSDVIVESGTVAGGASSATIFDHDFDVELNRPLDLNGLGIVNLGLWTVNSDITAWAVITLRKWDGSTETDICTNTSRVMSNGYSYLATDLDVPLTHYKKGETLRLNLTIKASNATGTPGTFCKYAHDPMARTTGWDSTGAVPSKLLFQCPVRLNL